MAKLMELQVGNKFNRLTVLNFDHYDNKHRKYYNFRCDCDIEKIIHGAAVVSGNTKSCGCYGKEVRKSKKLPNNKGVINQIVLQYKRHAKNRDIEWNLKYEEVEKIIQEPCFYCGAINSNHKITKNLPEGYNHNGIDRVDSGKGYLTTNVVPCCKICNYAKSNMKQKDFILWANKVSDYTKAMAEQWTKRSGLNDNLLNNYHNSLSNNSDNKSNSEHNSITKSPKNRQNE